MRFKGFNNRRLEFVRAVNAGATVSGYRMSDVDFCQVFEALFRDYHDMTESEDGRLRLVMSHSEEYPERIRGIFDAYFRFKNGVILASKVKVGPNVK